ncbi:MAG: flavodoxin family protein, partial [Gammaproteobacteria bacterium]
GSVAAGFKAFMEKLAGQAWLERMWVNKLAAGFTVSAGRSGDKLNCLQQMVLFAAQMGMIWVPLRITGGNYSSAGSEDDLNRMAGYLGVMAQANIDEPPELAPPPSDIATAELHGNHVAQVAQQYAHGRRALPADYDRFAEEAPGADAAPATLGELMGGSAPR